IAGLPFPYDRSLVPTRRRQVPIQAALAHIELGAEEELGVDDPPFRRGGRLDGRLAELRPRLAPREVRRLFAPEDLGLVDRLPVEGRVRRMRRDARARGKRRLRGETSIFFQPRLDVIRHQRSCGDERGNAEGGSLPRLPPPIRSRLAVTRSSSV